MSNTKNSPFDFGNMMPGFDFLKQMANKSPASNPFMPNAGSWITPTLSVEELDKRINELKTVKMWLENNARLIDATVQEPEANALAVQNAMQFWNGLTQQFGQITEQVLHDSKAAAAQMSKSSKASPRTSTTARSKTTAAKKAPAKKTTARKTSRG